MAGRRAFLLLTVCHMLPSGSALEVYVPSSRKAELGSNVLMPCTFSVGSSPINRQYLAIVWDFQGNEIVRYDSKGHKTQPRRYIDGKNIPEGAADLHIQDASVSDIGTYRCTITYIPDMSHKEVGLTVYARPFISALEKIQMGSEQDEIRCSVSGFYPEQIAVELMKDGLVLSGSVLSSPLQNDDKTFSINSSVTLPSTEEAKSFSCRVLHESLTAPMQQDLQLTPSDVGGNNSGLVGGVIAGVVIMIAALVIAAWLYKKCGTPEVLVYKIHGTRMMAGELSALHCTASNCPQDTQVRWTIRHKDGATCEITEGSTGDEEGEALMSMEYQMSTEKVPSQRRPSGHEITATLTFIPSISRHLGSAVTCRFITDKKAEEKTHQLEDIYARPRLMEPVQFIITNQGDVQLSASLDRFYPQPLQISWMSRRGQSQEKILSDEDVMRNPDATFTLTSKCTVSAELFKDPTYKVTVTWKHESIDNSQSQELSAKDLPWRPHIGPYVKRIVQGDEILLKCSVSDYFPDALTVKWFEKKKDCPDLLEVAKSETITMPKMISSRTDQKTFTATPCLSLKKSLLKEGVVFLCRVHHPSLERPIEAKTAQLRDNLIETLKRLQESTKPSIPEITNFIKSFSLRDCDNKGFTRVLLQLFGFLGHGKSSFINTCKYVLDDTEYKIYADVKKTTGGNTTERITYPLTDTLTLVDNRGCAFMNAYEAGEILAQLGNLLQLDRAVEWSKEFGLVDRIIQAERYVRPSDFVFPIFVHSVKKDLASHEVPEIKELLTTARELTGIFPVVVLTHKTNSNLEVVKAKFEDMGVERIFALENFTPEDHLKTRGKQEEVLKFFLEVIADIACQIDGFSDPEEERQKRKQFVQNYVQGREMKRKQEEMEREGQMERVMGRRRQREEEKKTEAFCTLQ